MLSDRPASSIQSSFEVPHRSIKGNLDDLNSCASKFRQETSDASTHRDGPVLGFGRTKDVHAAMTKFDEVHGSLPSPGFFVR